MRPVPPVPSPKSHTNVPFATPLFTLDEEALNETSWLIVGAVGENVNRATVGPVLGKSSIVNGTYVGSLWESVMLFSYDSAPVLASLAVKVTLACGVGAVPFE